MDAELKAQHLESLIRVLEMFIVGALVALMFNLKLLIACVVVPICVIFFALIHLWIRVVYNLRKKEG